MLLPMALILVTLRYARHFAPASPGADPTGRGQPGDTTEPDCRGTSGQCEGPDQGQGPDQDAGPDQDGPRERPAANP